MSRELLILRHAKSDWTLGENDFDRSLNKRGKNAAKRIGRWLDDEVIKPDYIISSPAKRALKTAQKVCTAFDYDFEEVYFDPRIYEADALILLAVLADCPNQAQRVLLIGHNPGLEDLIMYLAWRVPIAEDGKLLATATLARLIMPEDWLQLELHCAKLISITRAAALPD